MMNLISAVDSTLIFAGVLGIAIILVSVMLGIAVITASILRIKIFFAYWVTDRQMSSGGYTGESAANKLLSELGYTDIQVKETGFFSALIYGNHYNPNKKTVYLRKSTLCRSNLTAVGLALQKVGIVIQDKRDGNAVKKRWKLQKFILFGPILFIPIVLVGVILDLVTMIVSSGEFSGLGTFICTIIGIIYFLITLVLSFMNIKVEGKANRETLEILKKYDFLSPEEQSKVEKVFKTYLYSYIVDFIIGILEIIKMILKFIFTLVKSSSRNK